MSNLGKFDDILNELDEELKNLKGVTEAFQKISQLASDNAEVTQRFEQARQALEKLNAAHLTTKSVLEKSLADLTRANADGQKELSGLIDAKITELRDENKKFYRDLEDTIRIKLDDNKREVKSLIENERLQIKEIITNELAMRTREMRDAMESESGKQTALILAAAKQTRMALFILGGTSIALGIGILVKILMG